MKKTNLILILTSAMMLAACSHNDSDSTSEAKDSTSNDNASTSGMEDTSIINSSSSIDDGFITITTEEDLKNIANGLDKNYRLGNDVTLTSSWSSLGDSTTPFSGVLDGAGFSINNMNVTSSLIQIDDTSVEYLVGMFGESTGEIKNINFSNFEVDLTKEDIDATSYETVKNSLLTFEDFDVHVGVIGNNKGVIENVHANVNLKATPSTPSARLRIGSIAGKSTGDITHSLTTGSIQATTDDGYIRAGGLAGYVTGNALIENNETSVQVNTTVTTGAKMNVGGLIGNIETANVKNCLAIGNVIVTNTDEKAATAGGLIGMIDNTGGKYADMSVEVSNSYSIGTVTMTGKKTYAGGFIGEIDSEVSEITHILVSTNQTSSIPSGKKSSSGLVGNMDFGVDAAGSDIVLTNGKYEDIFVFENNASTIEDTLSSLVDEIVIPNSFTLL